MEQEKIDQEQEQDWRKNITEPTGTLKIADGESVVFTFQDEGTSNIHADFGKSVVFKTLVDGEQEPKSFYVNVMNYNLLGQIKQLGALKGLKVKMSRKGSRKSDTRYIVEQYDGPKEVTSEFPNIA